MNGSAPEPLSVDDAQILRLESVAIKGHTGKLLVLAPDAGGAGLDPAVLRDRVGERIASFPRLRQRVELPRHGQPSWVEAAPDLSWHVAQAGAGAPLDEEGFRLAAGEILARRLDHERPLWRLDVLALEDGRTGIVGRIHHAMADGVTAIRIAAGLLWDLPEKETAARPPRARRKRRLGGPSRLQRPPSTRRCRSTASPPSGPAPGNPSPRASPRRRHPAGPAHRLRARDRLDGGSAGSASSGSAERRARHDRQRRCPRRRRRRAPAVARGRGLAARQPPRPGPGLPSPP